MKSYVNLYLAEVFLECEMFQTNFVEKIKTQFYVQLFFTNIVPDRPQMNLT